ncbi:MAG TPA: YbhB/YbcL family Raf kinase inhibitor-like protein [Gammaproteobacteria bacterium]|nr:YbhB/YbcL family Raf kinase inhibitor-like protein [Gammaproteobacteria bacterium]
MSLHLYSEAFANEERIPVSYTCDGDDRSPPLEWAGAPEGTRSFALFCDDPDAPGGTFAHWAVYNIPAGVTFLEGGHSSRTSASPHPEGANDFGRATYGGPCPPAQHGSHRYRFRLLALGAERLAVPEGTPVAEVEEAAREHLLAEAGLEGHYEREG